MFIIAEIAQAHEGSLGIAHSYIDALAETGVNAVKFQTHIAEAESSPFEPFRINFSYEDKTRYDYWKRMEFNFEQWQGLKKHCEDKNLEFISSPFTVQAVNLLNELNVTKFKVGSGDISNYLMLEAIGKTGKQIIISSGMSNWTELDETMNFMINHKNKISLMQCTTSYPTKPEQWNLHQINEIKKRYHVPVGFSDHSSDIFACLAAAALGADLLEFHVVFDKSMFGPDSKSSIQINQVKKLVTGVNEITKSINSNIDYKNNNVEFTDIKEIFGKSLSINRDLPKGHIICFDDIESKKPAKMGISAKNFKLVIGKKLKKNLNQWDFLNFEDIEEIS